MTFHTRNLAQPTADPACRHTSANLPYTLDIDTRRSICEGFPIDGSVKACFRGGSSCG